MNDVLRHELQELSLDIKLWLMNPENVKQHSLALEPFNSGAGLIFRISQVLEKLK